MIIKATIFWRDKEEKLRQCTIKVPANEPSEIIREAVLQNKIDKLDYVWRVKCGRRLYQWYGIADEAFME